MALKDLEIRVLKLADRIYKKADERGLYVEVRPGGAKLWRLKYRFAGKDKRIALGPYPEVSLAEARRKRDEARQKLRDGIVVAEGRAVAAASKANWLLDQLAPVARRPPEPRHRRPGAFVGHCQSQIATPLPFFDLKARGGVPVRRRAAKVHADNT